MFSILLEQIKCEICPCLTILLNQCMNTGIFPEKFKITKILNNYRPISLLPTISKVFQRVIYNQLHNYLNTHHIITNCQYGFWRHHPTELTVIERIDRTTSELDNYKIPFNIDMSKAFDLIGFTAQTFTLRSRTSWSGGRIMAEQPRDQIPNEPDYTS